MTANYSVCLKARSEDREPTTVQTAAGTKVTGELGEMMRGYLFYNVQVDWHLTVIPNCQRRANHLLTCICAHLTLQSVRSDLSACKSDTQLYTDTLQPITVFMNMLFWMGAYGRVHKIITASNTVHGMLKKAPQLFHGAAFNILKHFWHSSIQYLCVCYNDWNIFYILIGSVRESAWNNNENTVKK